MTKNTIAAGRKVRFDPFETITGMGVEVFRGEEVIGTITKVYPEHQWFSVVWGDPKQRISFKFSDIGERVNFVG